MLKNVKRVQPLYHLSLRDYFVHSVEVLDQLFRMNPSIPAEHFFFSFEYVISFINTKFYDEIHISEGRMYAPRTFANIFSSTNKRVRFSKLDLSPGTLKTVKEFLRPFK